MSAPLLLGLLAAMNPVEPASEAPAVFAVIVAHNQSSDGSLAPLSYADDEPEDELATNDEPGAVAGPEEN